MTSQRRRLRHTSLAKGAARGLRRRRVCPGPAGGSASASTEGEQLGLVAHQREDGVRPDGADLSGPGGHRGQRAGGHLAGRARGGVADPDGPAERGQARVVAGRKLADLAEAGEGDGPTPLDGITPRRASSARVEELLGGEGVGRCLPQKEVQVQEVGLLGHPSPRQDTLLHPLRRDDSAAEEPACDGESGVGGPDQVGVALPQPARLSQENQQTKHSLEIGGRTETPQPRGQSGGDVNALLVEDGDGAAESGQRPGGQLAGGLHGRGSARQSASHGGGQRETATGCNRCRGQVTRDIKDSRIESRVKTQDDPVTPQCQYPLPAAQYPPHSPGRPPDRSH